MTRPAHELLGSVFDISKGCYDDGPGLRTTVFLKGCNLGCPWCHNPEGRDRAPLIGYDAARCIGCEQCVDACPRTWTFDQLESWRQGCLVCGRCVEVCPSGARRLVGEDMTVDALVGEVLADRDFFEGTGGGVTFSGGEPLLQAAFLFECMGRLRGEGVHVAVETAGLWPARLLPELVDSVDLVLFDIKHVDVDKLRATLGRDCRLVLDNLVGLLETDVELELRYTLVPGFNDGEDDLYALATWLGECGRAPAVKLQTFHRMATAKKDLYGVDYAYAHVEPTNDGHVTEAAKVLAARGVTVVGGAPP